MDSKLLLSDDMINLYPLQKTLCFELQPVGLTLEHLRKNKIRENAEERIKEFKEIKKLLDKIHTDIMKSGLKKLSKNEDFIKCLRLHEENREYYIDSCKNLYEEKKKLSELKKQDKEELVEEQKSIVRQQKKEVDNKKEIKEKNDEKLLALVKDSLTSDDRYNKIFSDKKLELLKYYCKDDAEKIKLIDHFSDFISYFNKYDSRIKSLYGDKKIATTYKSIGYRLITDNLPIFHANTEKIKYIKKRIKSISFDINFEKIEDFANYLTTEDINNYNEEIDKINSRIDNINKQIDKKNSEEGKNLKRCSYLGQLYILVDLDQDSDVLKRISDDKELIEIINEFLKRINLQNEEDIQKFKSIFSNLKKYDLETTYIKNSKFLEDLLKNIRIRGLKSPYIAFDNVIKYEWPEYFTEERKTQYINTFFSEISNLANELFKNYEEKYEKAKGVLTATYKINEKNLARIEYDKSNILLKIKDLLESDDNKSKKIVEQIKSLFKSEDNIQTKIKELLEFEDNKSKKIIEQVKKILEPENSLVKIKDLLESIKLLSTFVSWFVPKVKANKDYTNFFKVNFKIYNELKPERLAKIDQIYSHVRAYFSLKNFSTKKIRLNFDTNTCLNNWNLQEIKGTLGTIFLRKENGKINYYLGIINKDKFSEYIKRSDCSSEKILLYLSSKYTEESENVYTQMIYSKGDESDFFMTFKNISEKNINEMIEKDELYLFKIYNQDFSPYSHGNLKTHTIYWNNIFNKKNLELKRFYINGDAKLFYRPESLKSDVTHKADEDIYNKNIYRAKHKKTSNFPYPLIKDKRYTEEDKFLFHVSITINNEYECELTRTQKENKNIQEQLNKKILNKIKDGKIQHIVGISRSRDNLLCATVIDLNGELVDKPISLSTIKSVCFSKEKQKIDFEQDYNRLLNEKEAERAKANSVNNDGKKLCIQNVNNQNDKNIIKEWQSERSIKDFKDGYISQAVNEIAKLVIKYNAIVVFEDLEANSEKIDSKIEKSMYEKLEKALVRKLSFLILDKNLLPNQPGSSFRGYQFAYYEEKEKHRTEGKKTQVKQNGIIFYVPTNLTSNIDSNTGFMNCFCLPNDTDDFKKFIETCDSDIIQKFSSDNEEDYRFTIHYNLFKNLSDISNGKYKFLKENLVSNITKDLLDKFLEEKWNLYSNVERLLKLGYFDKLTEKQKDELSLVNERWERIVEEEYDVLGIGVKKYTYKKINLKAEFEKLFKNYSKYIQSVKREKILGFMNKDLNNSSVTKRTPSKGMNNFLNKMSNQKIEDPKENFVKEFIRLFSLLLQMRNYNKEKDYEYIVSPVIDKNNKQFFLSKADVNVSKNIALKGLLLINKIKKGKFDLKITDEEWIAHIIGKRFSKGKENKEDDEINRQ